MTHSKLIRTIFCALTFGGVNGLGAFGQNEPDWMTQIRHAWQARQETARTLQMEIESKKQFTKSMAAVGGAESEKTVRRMLSLAGERFSLRELYVEVDGQPKPSGARPSQETFDGQNSWYYSGTMGGDSIGTGAIDDTRYESGGAKLVDISPVILAYRPLNVELAKFDLSKCSLKGRSESVDGAACWLIEFARAHSIISKGLWLDPQRDFLPLRFQSWVNGKNSIRIDIRYREDETLGWLADSWDITFVDSETGDLDTSINCRVTNAAVNESIPDSEFVIAFPAGTHVDDGITGTSYIQEAPSNSLTWLLVICAVAVLGTAAFAMRSRIRRAKR